MSSLRFFPALKALTLRQPQLSRSLLSQSNISRTYILPATATATATVLSSNSRHSHALTLRGVRFKSYQRSKWASNPLIDYSELKPITEQPTDDVLLIDVREPEEVAMGSIPSSVNLPLSELEAALKPNYDPGTFRKKFFFDKPLPQQNIVFYCRSGKRSASAGEIAGENGYHNVRNYQGSWSDWSKREGKGGDDD